MKKRIIAFFLIFIMSLSLTACDSGNVNSGKTSTSSPVVNSNSVNSETSTSVTASGTSSSEPEISTSVSSETSAEPEVSSDPVASVSIETEPVEGDEKEESRSVDVYFMNGSPENIVISTVNPETKEQEVIDCVIKPGEVIKYSIADWKDSYEVFIFAVYDSNYEYTATYYFDMTGVTSYIQLLLGGEEKCETCSIYESK